MPRKVQSSINVICDDICWLSVRCCLFLLLYHSRLNGEHLNACLWYMCVKYVTLIFYSSQSWARTDHRRGSRRHCDYCYYYHHCGSNYQETKTTKVRLQ